MKIADILATKGGSVHSVRPWATVAELVDRLGELHIGALLVLDEGGGIQGIVSERDVVRALGRHGAGLLSMPVTAVLTSQVRTCTPDETVAGGLARVTGRPVPHPPGVPGGAPGGLGRHGGPG